jgi:YesN/AraC family two-component response regulator
MPDLIISDVMMPGINGFELVKQVRNDLRFSHIPVILLTAKVTVNDHITGYEAGADDYIYKPFDGEILKARLKNLLLQKENLRKHFIGSNGIINPKLKANNLDVQFIEEIINMIKNHFSEQEFNVNDIIEKMRMSRSIFYKKYKALSDQSINDLIRNFRLKKAAELLNSNQNTVSQVAYDCGFSDPAYFSKVFKEYYKISPKDYTSNGNGLK